MTLIPLMSAIIAAPEAILAPEAGPALRREAYDPGARHRPLAAAIAIGLPAALVVAVALSPMIVKPKPVLSPLTGTLIEIEKPVEPPPDKQPETSPTPKNPSVREAVKPIVETFPRTDLGAEVKPFIPDPLPYDPGPPARPADPPAPPALILAKLDPKYAGSFQPDYPASEQRREIEGVARVKVLIGTDGRVKAVELVSTDSPGFFEETKRRALAKWRFKPATRGGVAEESWQVMTVRFEIKSA
jgi:protein TonB